MSVQLFLAMSRFVLPAEVSALRLLIVRQRIPYGRKSEELVEERS